MFGAMLDAAMNIPKMMHAEEMQNDAQGFNRQEAIDQRDWTERMSNTQYQRASADASAAGLNRILAMRQGGNTAGGGATASSGSSAAALSSSFTQSELNESQIANIEQDTKNKVTLRHLIAEDYAVRREDGDLRNQQVLTEKENTRRARHEADMAGDTAKGRALEGEIDETKYGAIMRYIDRAMRAITGGSSAYRNSQPR